MIDISLLNKVDLRELGTHVLKVTQKMRQIGVDLIQYVCLKYLILLNPDVCGLSCVTAVEKNQEQVNSALLDYCITSQESSNHASGIAGDLWGTSMSSITGDKQRPDGFGTPSNPATRKGGGRERFGELVILLHDVKLLSLEFETFLRGQLAAGSIGENTLLAEMLNSRNS